MHGHRDAREAPGGRVQRAELDFLGSLGGIRSAENRYKQSDGQAQANFAEQLFLLIPD